MHRPSSVPAGLSLALLLAACGPAARPAGHTADSTAAPGAAAPLAEADIAAIRAADSAFGASANAGDLDGVVAVYAADAALLPPNLPGMKGSEAIRTFWGGFLQAYTIAFELQADQIEGRGDLAYVVGRYRLSGTPKAKGPPPLKDEGKFVEVLKRQSDGSWKYAVDIYNSDIPVK